MKKNLFGKKISILTSVLLVFAIISSVTLLSYAENNDSSEYGTKSEGITLSGSDDTVANRTAINYSSNNFNFNEGLKYFGPVRNASSRPYNTLAEGGVTYDETNGRLKLTYTETGSYSDWQGYGFQTVPVNIPEAAYGKKVYLKVDAASDFKMVQLRVLIDGNVVNTSNGAKLEGLYINAESLNNDSSQELKSFAVKNNWTNDAEFTIAEGSKTIAFSLFVNNQSNAESGNCAYFDNFRFIYFDDATNAYYNFDGTRLSGLDNETPYYGTEADGIVLNSTNDNVATRNAISTFDNFDFSKGLVNFAPSWLYGSNLKTLAESGIVCEDGMLKFKDEGKVTSVNYRGIQSVPVVIPEFAKGKTLHVSLDTAANMGYMINVLIDGSAAKCIKADGTDTNSANMYIQANDTTNAIGDVKNKLLVNTMATDNTGSNVLGIKIPENAQTIAILIYTPTVKSGNLAYIDNIKFLLSDIGGFIGKYTDLNGKPINNELGDANADGIVDIRDLVMTNDYLTDSVNTNIFFAAADLTNDKICNESDMAALRTKLLNAESSANYSLTGKNYIFLGSSITYGSNSDGWSMADYIDECNGEGTVTKLAVSGTTLSTAASVNLSDKNTYDNSYVCRLLTAMNETDIKCDHLIVQLSTNDSFANPPKTLGTFSGKGKSADTITVIGAIEYITAAAKEKWPNAEISFYTGVYTSNNVYKTMVTALNNIKGKLNIGVLDLYNDAGMHTLIDNDKTSYSNYMAADGLHPTEAGYREWIGPKFEKYLASFK